VTSLSLKKSIAAKNRKTDDSNLLSVQDKFVL
jgi:hypothetical protein